MNKNNVPSRLGNLNPVFRRRDKAEDDSILTKVLLKQARKSGNLNLSGKGLATVPEKLYEINDPDKDVEVTLDQLCAKEEDAWWNQLPLVNLDLSSNTLTKLSPKIERLCSLTTLSLHDNALVEIPKEIGKLEKLQRLNLSRNKLKSVPEEFFTLPELRYLNLSYNEFEELHPAISDLHMLETLDVSHNKLLTLPCGIGFLVRLTDFLLPYNQLKELPADLVNMRCLKKLDLMHNDLKALPADMGSLRKLQLLYINHNDIVELPDFDGCNELQELHAANNYIKTISEDLCNKLPHLKILDLRDNKIEQLPAEISLLHSLIRLDISNNAVNSLPTSLSSLANLVSLQVEGNPIKSIRRDIIQCGTDRILKTLKDRAVKNGDTLPKTLSKSSMQTKKSQEDKDDNGVFPSLYQLKNSRCLAVKMANLTDVPDKVFQTAAEEGIGMVDFSKNRLENIPTGLKLMQNCATELTFTHNCLKEVPIFLSQFKHISMINFSCNLLQELPKEFGILITLRELAIASNRFTDLPDCIYDLQSLEILIANDNQIRNINVDGLSRLKRLATLNLGNNNIDQVPPQLGNQKSIKCLELKGNPFRMPRLQILDRGTDTIMSYLRDRIPN